MRLKELRAEKGATQKEVAEVICCSPLVYSRYEREVREPDIDALCKLADYFNVTVDYIVCRTYKKGGFAFFFIITRLFRAVPT